MKDEHTDMSKTHDYGEPWTFDHSNPCPTIHSTKKRWLIADRGIRSEDLQRIASCVNACAGIPDPVAALTAAREALKYAVRMLDAKEHDVAFVQEALNLLTPAP